LTYAEAPGMQTTCYKQKQEQRHRARASAPQEAYLRSAVQVHPKLYTHR